MNQELRIKAKKNFITTMIHDSLFMIRKSKGFTLIELLVVITVIGILAGALLVVINPVEQLKKSRDAQRKHDLSQLQKALEVYYNDMSKYPSSIPLNTWSGYIEKMPKDPSGQAYLYQVSADRSSYQLTANLERCSDMQVTIRIGDNCSYRVTSPNLAVGGDDSFPAITPSSEITPTIVIATSTPSPTSTITPTPTLFPVKRVFISKTWVDGSINGYKDVIGADNFCRDQAMQNSLSGTWVAWLSDGGSGTAVSRLNPSGNQYRYRLVDNTTIVANSWTDLTDGTLLHAIDKDQFGALSQGIVVWTNTTTNGTRDGSGANNSCVNWGNNTNTKTGKVGHNGYIDSKWTQYSPEGNKDCDGYRALYCFEK